MTSRTALEDDEAIVVRVQFVYRSRLETAQHKLYVADNAHTLQQFIPKDSRSLSFSTSTFSLHSIDQGTVVA